MREPHISLVRFNPEVNGKYISALEEGWDWPLSMAFSLEEFMTKNHSDSRFIGYWILIDETPVGLIDFKKYSEPSAKGTISIGIYIHSDNRGTNTARIALASAVVSLQDMQIPAIATVHVDNKRSWKMVRHTVGFDGQYIHEESKNRYAWFFDFRINDCSREYLDTNCYDLITNDKELFKNMVESFN